MSVELETYSINLKIMIKINKERQSIRNQRKKCIINVKNGVGINVKTVGMTALIIGVGGKWKWHLKKACVGGPRRKSLKKPTTVMNSVAY